METRVLGGALEGDDLGDLIRALLLCICGGLALLVVLELAVLVEVVALIIDAAGSASAFASAGLHLARDESGRLAIGAPRDVVAGGAGLAIVLLLLLDVQVLDRVDAGGDEGGEDRLLVFGLDGGSES